MTRNNMVGASLGYLHSDPQYSQDSEGDDTHPADRTHAEYDRGLKEHEAKKAVDRTNNDWGTRAVRTGINPPPHNVDKPNRGKDIVEVKAAAPSEAEEFGRSMRRVGVRSRMAPIMIEPKGTREMSQVRGAAGRPEQSSQFGLLAREKHRG